MKKIILCVLFSIVIFSCKENSAELNDDNVNIDSTYDVVIVGGGFSGLTAAYLLNTKKILVLEKENLAGGRCISGKWNGFHYPKGTEYIGEPDEEMQKFFNELGIITEKIPAPTDGNAMNGKFYFSQNLLGFLTSEEQEQYYDLKEKLIALSDQGIEDAIFNEQEMIQNYKNLDLVSVKDWYTGNGISPTIQKYVNVENRGLFGTDNSNFSMLFNIPEMAFNLPDPESINQSEVFSFNNGMHSIVEKLTKILGEKVVTGAYVDYIEVQEDKSVSVSYVKDGKRTKIAAKTIIITTPAPVTDKIVNNYFSDDVRAALASIKYSQYATINFFTNKRFLKEAWSVACIDEGQVVTLYDVIKPQVSDNYNGKSILSVYMAPENAFDNGFIQQTDERLIQNAYNTLNKYYPDFEINVIDYDIQRFMYAFPIFGPNYGEKIEILRKDKSVNGPIFLAGDYMVYATFDGAIISARNAVKKVSQYLENDK